MHHSNLVIRITEDSNDSSFSLADGNNFHYGPNLSVHFENGNFPLGTDVPERFFQGGKYYLLMCEIQFLP